MTPTRQGLSPVEHVTSDREFDRLVHQAQILSRSGLVPKALRGRPDDITLVMTTGRDLGWAPTVALSLIHVIEGTVSIASQGQLGLARAAGHEIWLEQSDEHSATYCGRRRGSSHVERITWTIDQAKRANLLGKPNWKQYPEAMLRARAASNLVKVLCPDVLMGLPATPPEYEAEHEFIDGEVVEEQHQLTAGPETDSPAGEAGGKSKATQAPAGDEEPSSSASSTTASSAGAGGDEFTEADEVCVGEFNQDKFQDICDRFHWSNEQRAALVRYASGGRTDKYRMLYKREAVPEKDEHGHPTVTPLGKAIRQLTREPKALDFGHDSSGRVIVINAPDPTLMDDSGRPFDE